MALSNGHAYGADLVVFATGVTPTGWEMLPRELLQQWQPTPGTATTTADGPASSSESSIKLLRTVPLTGTTAAGYPRISGPSEMEALLQRLSSDEEASLAALLLDGDAEAGISCRSAAGGAVAAAGCGTSSASPSPSAAPPPRPFILGPDGGLLVNSRMQTTGSPHIYAAGDAATVLWPQLARRRQRWGRRRAGASAASGGTAADSGLGRGVEAEAEAEADDDPPLWFQMRLWNQARAQAIRAARAMTRTLDALEADDGGPAFDMFAHTTRFCGFRVTLLGLFNGQGLLGGDAAAAARNLLVAEEDGGDAHVSRVSSREAGGAGASAAATSDAAGAGSAAGNRDDRGRIGDAGSAASSTARGGARSSKIATTRASKRGRLQVQVRVTPGHEYAKIVLLGRRVVGALLIGDAADSIAETLENLILNRLPLTATGSKTSSSNGCGGDRHHDAGEAQGDDAACDVLDLLSNDNLDDVFD